MGGKKNSNGAIISKRQLGIIFLVILLPIFAVAALVIDISFTVYAIFSLAVGMAGLLNLKILTIGKNYLMNMMIGMGMGIVWIIVMGNIVPNSMVPINLFALNLQDLGLGLTETFFVAFVFVAVLNVITEEGFFNAFLSQEWLGKSQNRNLFATVFLLFAISAIFALGHVTNYAKNYAETIPLTVSLPIAFTARFLMCGLAVVQKDISGALGFHFVVNVGSFIV